MILVEKWKYDSGRKIKIWYWYKSENIIVVENEIKPCDSKFRKIGSGFSCMFDPAGLPFPDFRQTWGRWVL